MMSQKTCRILEFDAVQKRVSERSLSDEAARRILAESPLTDADAVNRLKTCVEAVRARMEDPVAAPEKQESLPDISGLLPKLNVEGAALDLEEAFAAGLFAERGMNLKHWLLPPAKDDSAPVSALTETVQAIPNCSDIADEVFRILTKDGALRDLPEFQAINRIIKRLSAELDAAVSRYAANEETRRMLQSAVPSQRDGRAVLAVKANFRARIRGIVHEASATGQTLFIEPEEVVEKNNDLLIEKRRLDAEIARVLRELTAKIAAHRETLVLFHEKIIEVEILRTKARYSKETGGVFAQEGALALKQARHPLLGRDSAVTGNVVPIDFIMNEGDRVVIITGPNTGGKTVTLKTAGLFALMNQSGVALPAAEGTSMPLFDGVFADIGDEQSISQSLSTFSAHMTNIAAITQSATERSLVLLDELGSGTDPEEGGAIAMALLDFFIEENSLLIVTSHHGVLKNYGYTRKRVENASVEFDGRTLSPTYRIAMGLPGESRAIDIASRNGLNENIIGRARSYIGENRSDVSALIAGLKKKRLELDTEDEARRLEDKRLLEKRRQADLKELRLRQKEMEIKNGEIGRLRKMLEESRKNLENLVRELKEGEISREKTLKVKDFLKNLENDVINEADILEKEETALKILQKERDGYTEPKEDAVGEDAPILEEGAEVLVSSYKQRGRIVRKEKNGWLVEIGSLRTVFRDEDLVPMKSAPVKPALALTDLVGGTDAVLELNILGMRLEEASGALSRQIDAAVLAGLPAFAVIHGKGGGVLQKGVHDILRRDNRIADFGFSRPELGGFGRTEVTLRQ